MMNSLTEKRFPFWNYTDLLLLIGLLVPCLIGGTAVSQTLALINPVLADAKLWVGMLVFYALWFGCLYLVLRMRYFDENIANALGWIYPHRGLFICIISGPLLAILVNVIGALLKTPDNDLPIKKLLQGQLSMALFGIFAVILAPVTEELAFRGFLMPLFIRTFGRELGIVLTAAPFGLLHGSEYGWHWQYIVLIGLAGVVFGIIRQWTGSTLASATMHATYNLTFFVSTVLYTHP